MLDLSTPTNEQSLMVTTALEKNRVVANVSGLENQVDEAFIQGVTAREAANKWDGFKPRLRTIAKKVLAQLKQEGTLVRAVMLQGTGDRVVEVCPSDKRKDLIAELVNEAKFRGLEEIITEDTEVVLTGPLAQWAIKTLPLVADKTLLSGNFFVKHRNLLSDGFETLTKKIKNGIMSPEVTDLLERLSDGGYNSPAVEAKTKKNV